MKTILQMGTIAFLSGCGNSDKILKLEQEIARQQTEITATTDNLTDAKLQIEQINKELEMATSKNSIASVKIQELEAKINSLTEGIGKDGLILPVYLIGRTVIIYTKPYTDTQIFIGVTQKIIHDNKVTLQLSQTNQQVEIPFSSIIGYRILE